MEQLTAPVRWVECMHAAAEAAGSTTFLEAGPGTVLSGLVRRIIPSATTTALGTAADAARLREGAA